MKTDTHTHRHIQFTSASSSTVLLPRTCPRPTAQATLGCSRMRLPKRKYASERVPATHPHPPTRPSKQILKPVRPGFRNIQTTGLFPVAPILDVLTTGSFWCAAVSARPYRQCVCDVVVPPRLRERDFIDCDLTGICPQLAGLQT